MPVVPRWYHRFFFWGTVMADRSESGDKDIRRFVLRLPDPLCEALDEEARLRERSRNWVIERALWAWVKKTRSDRERRKGDDE